MNKFDWNQSLSYWIVDYYSVSTSLPFNWTNEWSFDGVRWYFQKDLFGAMQLIEGAMVY